MSHLIATPEFQLNALVAGLALLLMTWGRVERTSHRVLFGALTALLLMRYAVWRVTATMPPSDLGFETLFAWVFLFFEMTAVVYTLMSIHMLVRRRDNRRLADLGEAALRGRGADVPALDVFICTYNEELAVLEKTIIAAQAIDYPRLQVWVLDDTRRDWLRDYCARRGVNYARRPDNSHAKAGNLNNGLRLSAQTTNAPFILVLDADFAPRRQIAYRMLGLFDDPKVGLVQTPQFYYNADPIQHNLRATDSWVDEQRVFFDVLQPAKDAVDSAFCVGTSFIVRRDLITAAGGFPVGSVCEDIHTTYLLLRHGHVTRWLGERLSNGLSAESIIDYINQRSRWCLGTVQLALLPNGPLRGKGYSLSARLHFLHGLLHWLGKPFMALIMLAPALYWYADVSAFHATPQAFAAYGLPPLVMFWAYSYWISQRRCLPVFSEVSQLVAAMAVTGTLLSAMLKPFGHPFKVTAKGLDRSKTVVHWKLVAVFGGLLVALQLGGATAIMTGPALAPGDELNLVWTGIALVLCLGALIACVDLPRPEGEERFPWSAATRVRTAAGEGDSRFVNIAADGALLEGGAVLRRLRAGQPLEVHVETVGWLPAFIVRRRRAGAELRFAATEAQREQLVSHVFNVSPSHVAVQVRPWGAASALLASAGFGSPGAGFVRTFLRLSLLVLAVCVLLATSGCNLTPPLKQPDLAVPSSWPAGATVATAQPADWRGFVQDEELRGLIDTALRQNRDLRVYAARAREARAVYAGSRASLFPQLGLSGNAQRAQTTPQGSLSPVGNVPSDGRVSNSFDIQAGVMSYELDFFGRQRSSAQQSGALAEAGNMDYAAARMNLVGEVANAYLALRADRALLALADANAASLSANADMIGRAKAVGGAAQLDVYRAQSLLQNARVRQEEYRMRVAQDLQGLNVLVGQPVPQDTGSARPWPERSTEQVAAGLPSSLLQRRPDLLAAHARVEAANAGIGAAKAAMLPTISLTALTGGVSNELSTLLSSGNRSWAGVLGVSLPLFDWGRRSANITSNEEKLAAAMASYESAAQVALRETANALIASDHLRPQLEAQQLRVQSLENVARISQARFRSGLEDYFSSQDAQRELYAEQQQLIELQLKDAVNLVNLYKALGGGWSRA
ncbi:cellulose synthase (UDP-forming) [Variovorax paradoxus]|uniref:efflux transporter outer membrane subunit n=1 Tax=Variovorax atrisoli TaxID=3394203 RepID=UPI001199EB4A|nr:efflux transporter outer membrane subunit [Variovorax paradoxus]MDR6520737.1 cellulose synthase (UDP-forming) [Variovorax paradoxus]